MHVREFVTYLRGLSPESMWRHAVRNTPVIVEGDDAARLISKL
jgi:hypothetical protein